MVPPHATFLRYMGLCDCYIDNTMNFLQGYLDVTGLCCKTLTYPMITPLLKYVIPDRSDECGISPHNVTCTLESWLPHAGMGLPVLLRVVVKLVRVMLPTPTWILLVSLLRRKTRKTM